ncbi:MAG: ATP-binding protein [Thermobispora bispora]|nr:ATP-binding protein [Thermobispora bispora]
MATVELTFSALPAHVRTARLVAAAVARRTGVPEAILDEVRLAVGEACLRAVEAHRLRCPAEPVVMRLRDDDGRFEVTVIDAASRDGVSPPAAEANGSPLPEMGDLGLAVIAGLADDVEVVPRPEGMSIRMSWPVSPGEPTAA